MVRMMAQVNRLILRMMKCRQQARTMKQTVYWTVATSQWAKATQSGRVGSVGEDLSEGMLLMLFTSYVLVEVVSKADREWHVPVRISNRSKPPNTVRRST